MERVHVCCIRTLFLVISSLIMLDCETAGAYTGVALFNRTDKLLQVFKIFNAVCLCVTLEVLLLMCGVIVMWMSNVNVRLEDLLLKGNLLSARFIIVWLVLSSLLSSISYVIVS